MRYTAIFYKEGKLREAALPLIRELLQEKVQSDENECWIWQESRDTHGYGRVYFGSYDGHAHRLSYRAFKGPIPNGLFILHSCDNPPCINPDHLKVGTQQDNMDDVRERGRGKNKATHCKNGHEFTEENTVWNGSQRFCRACRQTASRNYARRTREADPEAARAQVQQWRNDNRERFNANSRKYSKRRVRERLGLPPDGRTDLRGKT